MEHQKTPEDTRRHGPCFQFGAPEDVRGFSSHWSELKGVFGVCGGPTSRPPSCPFMGEGSGPTNRRIRKKGWYPLILTSQIWRTWTFFSFFFRIFRAERRFFTGFQGWLRVWACQEKNWVVDLIYETLVMYTIWCHFRAFTTGATSHRRWFPCWYM